MFLVVLVLLLHLPNDVLRRLRHHPDLRVDYHKLDQLQELLEPVLLDAQGRLLGVRHVQVLLISDQQRDPPPLAGG